MTYIGRADLISNPMSNLEAFLKHLIHLYKENNLLKQDNYYFEDYPAKQDRVDLLRYIKTLYEFLKKNMPELPTIESELFVKYVHSTTSIEGVTLDLRETQNMLSEAELTPDSKPFRDSQATLNYKSVKRYTDNYHGEINEKFIKQLHILIMNNLHEGPLGQYREIDRGVPGINHSRWQDISKDINQLLIWYNGSNESHLHPVELASKFHQRFEEIHPFHDGNGRTGRAILDYMLKINGFPMIYIPIKQQYDYQSALRAGNTTPKRSPNYVPLIDFIINRLQATFTYITAKTRFYQVIQSNEFQNFLISQSSEETVNQLLEGLRIYHESEEDY